MPTIAAESHAPDRMPASDDAMVARLKKSLLLLFGFLAGCIVAAIATSLLRDWAWSLPVALATLAVALL